MFKNSQENALTYSIWLSKKKKLSKEKIINASDYVIQN